jgi:hypothetical protein
MECFRDVGLSCLCVLHRTKCPLLMLFIPRAFLQGRRAMVNMWQLKGRNDGGTPFYFFYFMKQTTLHKLEIKFILIVSCDWSTRFMQLILPGLSLVRTNSQVLLLEVHNRIKIHTVYRMSSYRIQYSLEPITVYNPKKQVNSEKYR